MPRHRYEEPIPYTSTQPSFEIPQLVPDEELGASLLPLDSEHDSIATPIVEVAVNEEHRLTGYDTPQILAQRAIRHSTPTVQAMPQYVPGRWLHK